MNTSPGRLEKRKEALRSLISFLSLLRADVIGGVDAGTLTEIRVAKSSVIKSLQNQLRQANGRAFPADRRRAVDQAAGLRERMAARKAR